MLTLPDLTCPGRQLGCVPLILGCRWREGLLAPRQLSSSLATCAYVLQLSLALCRVPVLCLQNCSGCGLL